jgi:hypothetical protein
MSLRVYRAALALAKTTDEVIVIGGGEPTIHPEFLTVLIEGMAASSDDIPVWLATNGNQTNIALMLARLARKGVISCALSQDKYHDKIDPRVVKAFTEGKKAPTYTCGGEASNDGREVRNVMGREIKAGRCTWGQEDGCICSEITIKPDGSVYGCGCKGAPKFGNVLKTVDIPTNWEVGECSRRQPKE